MSETNDPAPGETPSPETWPPVLMSAANPTGWKLEDLLDALRADLLAKNDRLQHVAEDQSGVVAATVFRNNMRIMILLAQAQVLQRDSLAQLATLGPDQGPTGTPRVGAGSAGSA